MSTLWKKLLHHHTSKKLFAAMVGEKSFYLCRNISRCLAVHIWFRYRFIGWPPINRILGDS